MKGSGRLPRLESPVTPEELIRCLEVGEEQGPSDTPASFVARYVAAEAYSYLLRSGGISKDQVNPDDELPDLCAEARSAFPYLNTLEPADRSAFETLLAACSVMETVKEGDAEAAAQAAIRMMVGVMERVLILAEAGSDALFEKLREIAKETQQAPLLVPTRELLQRRCPGYVKPLSATDRLRRRIVGLAEESRRRRHPSPLRHRLLLECLLEVAEEQAAVLNIRFDRFEIPGTWNDLHGLLVRAGARNCSLLTVSPSKLRAFAKRKPKDPWQDRALCQLQQGKIRPPAWRQLFPELY